MTINLLNGLCSGDVEQLKMSGLNVLTRSQGLVRRNCSLALLKQLKDIAGKGWFDLPAQTITPEIQKDLRLLKAVNGIALPLRCNKLCSGSSDGTIRLWDCRAGQCANVINLGGKVGSVCSEGPWLFVGMPNVVKVWNTESGAEYSLNGPVGQVNALESINDLLFAGVEDGVILAWKGTYETNITFQLAATLKGHTHGITSLVVGGGNRLYSGSKDQTIRVWDHENLQCIMTLNGHDDVVKSLMCWDKYLFFGSLECTIKVWASTEDGSLEVIYTHSEEHGILALSGMTDLSVKPILYCSCSDKSVHLYELPNIH
uniref:Uncharacterized protein n=1 Tax=Quercus lobata TaxID=97700 RepID=A0A7N2LJY7_QUELO